MNQAEWQSLTPEQQRAQYLDAWSRAAMAEVSNLDLHAELERMTEQRDTAEDAVVSYVRPCPHCHDDEAPADRCTCISAFDKIAAVLDRVADDDLTG